MKKNFIQFAKIAKCTAVLVLACAVTFTSCSKNDDEPSVDELLSKETTPIDFEITNFNWGYEAMLFDYAGNNYIGSDTLSRDKKTIDLRQGKHHLIWMDGLKKDGVSSSWYKDELLSWKYTSGSHFDPITRTVTTYTDYGAERPVRYYEKDFEVYPYLMPVQKVEYNQYLTAEAYIYITDTHPNLPMPAKGEENYPFERFEEVGKMTGFPHIKMVSLDNNRYEMMEKEYEHVIYTCDMGTYWNWHGGYDPNWHDKYDLFDYDNAPSGFVMTDVTGYQMLCPKDGLNNIQLTTEVHDIDGAPIPTTKLPKFSIRRGYTTVLRGPLYSGSTSDWTVEMVPYDD
ncbi:MAG: hypothetical protein IJ635_01175 [Bacteroidaceae bacterium]|nr:hypothetical protein [Bacteroidaceae bacterium]